MNLFKLALWKKIIIGMVAGIVVGSIWGEHSIHLQPLGELFISAVQMLIVPLIFCSLASAMTTVSDIKKMSRIGGKTVVFYLLTSVIAISVGIILGYILRPGENVELIGSMANNAHIIIDDVPSVLDILLHIIPSNPIESLATGNILQILFFAILFGMAINLIGKEGKALSPIFEAGASAMYKLTSLVMELAPYGVFALMASFAGTHGVSSLLPLLKLVLVIYGGFLLLVLFVYAPIIWFVGGLSPSYFFKRLREVLIFAFSTSSSSATLPVSITCAKNKLGVSKIVRSFVLPLGATINMNGTALYQGVIAVFISQIYGIDFTMNQILVIMLTSLLSAIGTAGVPGAGVIMLSIVLSAVGLPLEGIGLVLAVDRIIDMGRSALNVTGDLVVATIVAKSENEIDFNIMNDSDDVRLKKVPAKAKI